MTVRRVSIALATYNGARFLAEQLESYAAQTRLPDELVVGDDSSSDETHQILADFAARAPFPVSVTVNRPGLGPGANFIETALRCSGDVLFFSDQDDRWHPEKVERMLAVLEAAPNHWLALHDAALMDGEGRLLGPTLVSQMVSAGEEPVLAHISGCCMAIDARLAALFDVKPEVRLHDAWIGTLSRALGLTCVTPDVLIDYRRHGNNVSESFVAQTHKATRLDVFRQRLRVARQEPVAKALRITLDESEAAILALDRHRFVLEQVVAASKIASVRESYVAGAARARRRLAVDVARGLGRVRPLLRCAASGDYLGLNGMVRLTRDLGLIGSNS